MFTISPEGASPDRLLFRTGAAKVLADMECGELPLRKKK